MEPETQNGGNGSAGLIKTVIWLVVLVLVVGGFILYGSKGGEPTVKEPIKIGFIGPLTGDAAVYGEPMRNVADMAVSEINSAGGVDGRQLSVIFEDGKCNGKDAANAAQKLINVDKVKVIIGGFCLSESLAAVPIVKEAGVFLISGGSSSPDLTGIDPLFARTYPNDTTQGVVLAGDAAKRGWKKVAVIQEQLDYPLGIFKAFSVEFEKKGGAVVKEEFSSSSTDFRSSLAKLKAANSDALFVIVQTAPAAERILKQMTELKWTIPLLVNDVVSGDTALLTNSAKVLEGTLAAEYGTDPINVKFQAMLAAYKTKYNVDMLYPQYGQTIYDAVYLIADAMRAVGENPEKIAAWVRSTVGWIGASGMVDIGDDGDRIGGHVLKIIKNGKAEVLPETPAQTETEKVTQ